jgi:hypothetical protein
MIRLLRALDPHVDDEVVLRAKEDREHVGEFDPHAGVDVSVVDLTTMSI